MLSVISLLRRVDLRAWIIFVVCFGMYYFVYARYYTSGEIVHCCDTHGMWTIEYLALYSIARTGEFVWWDPTGVGGWPIYSNLLNWTFNYFSPYSLPYLGGFWLLSRFHEISPQGINEALVYEKVIYYYLLNFIAVMLISREVLKTYLARFFVAIVFTLGVIQFQGFRDSHQYMALAGPLFYIWGLLYYDRRRTFQSFLVFVIVTGLLVSSLSYAFTQSGFYWSVAFTVFLVAFHPSVLRDVRKHFRQGWETRWGRLCLVLGVLLFAFGLAAPLSSVALNAGHLMRVTGMRPLDWSHGIFGDWDPPYFGVPPYELWTNVMYFAPRSEIHNLILTFDPWKVSGIDHRYIGLLALPLCLAGLVLGYQRRYFGTLFLAFFVCVVFVPYTVDNLAYFSLMHLQAFQNVRTVGGLLPRDGPALFLSLIAALGLDQLLLRVSATAGGAAQIDRDRRLDYVLVAGLAGLIIFAAIVFVAGVRSGTAAELRSTFTYTGLYLGLFAMLVLLLLFAKSHRGARTLTVMLLVLAITDLILSGSHYFAKRPNHNNMIYRDVPGSSWSKPRPNEIGPITSEAQSWAGQDYRGIMHNLAGGPWVGLREWLILEGRPAMASLLENWNRETKFMRAYPHFRFYTAGRFVPYDTIKAIDGIETPNGPGQWVYVHDMQLAESSAGTAKPVPATWQIEEFTFNRVRVHVSMPQDGVMIYFDNYDPWWKAYIDGERTTIHRANFAFKAIQLKAGEHSVEWKFNPYPVKIAWSLFYLCLLAYGYCMWRWLRMARSAAVVQ